MIQQFMWEATYSPEFAMPMQVMFEEDPNASDNKRWSLFLLEWFGI